MSGWGYQAYQGGAQAGMPHQGGNPTPNFMLCMVPMPLVQPGSEGNTAPNGLLPQQQSALPVSAEGTDPAIRNGSAGCFGQRPVGPALDGGANSGMAPLPGPTANSQAGAFITSGMPGTLAPWPAANVQDVAAAGGSFAMYDPKSGQIALPQNHQGMPANGSYDNQRWMPGNGSNAPGSWAKASASAQPFVPTDRHNNGSGTPFASATALSAPTTTSPVLVPPAVHHARQSHQVSRDVANSTESFSSLQRNQQHKSATHQPFESSVGNNYVDRKRRVNNARLSRPTAAENAPAAGQATVQRQQMQQQNKQQHQYQRHHQDSIIPGTVGHDRKTGSSEKHTRPRSCIDALNLEAVVNQIPIEGSVPQRQKHKGLSQQQLFGHQRSEVMDKRIAAGADAAAGPLAAASLGKTQQKDNKGNPTREKYVPPALRKRKEEEEEAALKARQYLEAQAKRVTERDTQNIESARVTDGLDEKGDESIDFKQQDCARLATEETAARDGALDVPNDSKLLIQCPTRGSSPAHVESEVVAADELDADKVVVIEEAPLIFVEEATRVHAALTEDVPVKSIVEEEQTVAPEVPAEAPQDKPAVGQVSWADRLKAIKAKPAPKAKAPPPKPVGIPQHPKPAPWAKERDQRQFEESRKQREEEAERVQRQTEQREHEERLQQEKIEKEAEERRQKEESEARVKAEADKNLREAEAERMREEEEERSRKAAEDLLRKEAEKRAQQEAEERAREEEEERLRKEEEERLREEEEEKQAQQEQEERMRKEAEEREQKEAEERLRKETEERLRQEAEKRVRKETEERLQREAEERQRKEAEERAQKEAEECAKKEIEERRRKEAEERRKEAEARAQKEAEEQAQKEAEERAQREAEESAQKEAQELARKKAAAEERVRKEAEDRKRQEAEERKRNEAELKIAEEFARREAENCRAKEAEERLRSEEEETALRDAAQRRHDAEEDRIRREAELAQSGKDQTLISVDSAEERLAKPSATAWVSKRSKAKASKEAPAVTSGKDVSLSRDCKEDAPGTVNDDPPAAVAKSRATADGAPIDAPSASSAAPAEVKKLGGLFAKPKGARKGLKKSTAGTSGSAASEVPRDEEEEEKEEDASREDVSPPVVVPEARPSTSATAARIPIPAGDEFEAAAFAAVNAIKARDNSQDCLRDVFLSYRFLAAQPPSAVAQLVAREREGAWQAGSALHVGDRGGRSGGGERVVDRSMFGSRMSSGKDLDRRGDRRERGERQDRGDRQERSARGPALVPSESAWKPSMKEADGKKSPKQELTRQAQSLLNKICPENVQVIATRIKNELQVNSVQELKWLIESVFKKAIHEMHYSETYADLVYRLKTEMPEFPSENGGKPITFKTTLLNVCQSGFESMLPTLSNPQDEKDKVDADELEMRRQKRKARILANMRFIGNLFLRQLLTAKIIASVLSELTLQESQDANMIPEEHVIECICELLTSIGYTLESVPGGKLCLQTVCGRLLDLKNRKTKDGTKIFSKRIQFHIQDVLDTRAAGWAKRTFKKEAATRDEIRAAHQRDLAAAASGKTVDEADVVIAGARPAYMAPESGGNTKGADGKESWQEVPKPRRERKV